MELREAIGRRRSIRFLLPYQPVDGCHAPFPRDPALVAELEQDRMLQTPAPLPWREAELEYLKVALGIKGHGLL